MAVEDIKGKQEKKSDTVGDNITEEINSNFEANVDDLKDEANNVEYEKIQNEYENTLKELEEVDNRYLRLQADFNNYRKRVEKEKESTYLYASQELICKLLPVIDNFDRALEIKIDETKLENFYQGVELVYKQFVDILKDSGLEEIDALNQKFDPNYHHAVAQEESDQHAEDTVMEVFLKGYMLKDRVVRPSMVKVAK
ncbi:nucleotide exchange factor GrpE [Brassicibacter mesophilus]|uniref:nucleotide exchange factor GrpE n=1 Tax=Brassicibacter mesophilus TaxID=745119 RepID=UPI003D1E18AD